MAHSCSNDIRHGLERRDMMRASVGGFLGFALSRQADLFGSPQPTLLLPRAGAKAKSLIVLYMVGGPSQFETFSPLEGSRNSGPTKAIQTSVPGIKYSENLPNVAKQARHIAVVRSMTSREGSHERGRYLLHTGYVPTGTVAHPSLGSVTACEIGQENFDLPNYIAISGRSHGAGFLAPEFNPFIIDNPGSRLPNLTYTPGVTQKRYETRMKLLKEQEKDFARDRASKETEKHKIAYDKADRLMHTPLLKAFDLKQENASTLKAYGDSKFGKGCLLARRLVEVGVPAVEVNLGGWDTHRDNFKEVGDACKQLDPGMSALIGDLERRGMLDETMVIWMGEFGRTPRINGNDGRDHYPRAWTLAMAGGGIKGGRVVGATDKDGVEVLENPVTVPDLMTTIYTCLGIDPDKQNLSPLGRPIRLADNGTPVKDLIS